MIQRVRPSARTITGGSNVFVGPVIQVIRAIKNDLLSYGFARFKYRLFFE